VGELGLFEHDVDFLHVRAGQGIKIDHGNVLRFLFGFWRKAVNLSAAFGAGKGGTTAVGQRARYADHLCDIADAA
ncbi:MAG: hypothetical protein WBE64_20160, partial [Xanthobacteraceae bacterium]